MDTHAAEIESGQRFEFGKNWLNFLSGLTEDKLRSSEASMQDVLGTTTLAGKSFLDIGSGSGLFSLAARRLGAKVYSFDYDPSSVACTRFLKEKYFKDDSDWVVEEHSVLDDEYMAQRRGFDVVYSWGVLHHTGQMWKAIGNAAATVGHGGQFVISIYNDQGPWSRRWTRLKRLYNALPRFLRFPYTVLVMGAREIPTFLWAVVKGEVLSYSRLYWKYGNSGRSRGMNRWHDMVDWIGGYPFEVAKPEEIFKFFKARGFELVDLSTCAGGVGCNEYVFRKVGTGGAL